MRGLRRWVRAWRCRLCVLLAAALVGGVYALWESALADQVFPKRWASVDDGLVYRSGQVSARLVGRTWRKHGIRVVVNLGIDKPGHEAHEAAQEAARELGIDRVFFPLRGDGTGDVEAYIGAVATIDRAADAGEPVVVHCAAGVNRTGGVVAVYRMLIEGWSGEEAYEEMMSFGVERTTPVPRYVNERMERIVEGLIERGVLDEAPDPMPRLGPAPLAEPRVSGLGRGTG